MTITICISEEEIKTIMTDIDMAYSGGGFSSITQEIIAKKIKRELERKEKSKA